MHKLWEKVICARGAAVAARARNQARLRFDEQEQQSDSCAASLSPKQAMNNRVIPARLRHPERQAVLWLLAQA